MMKQNPIEKEDSREELAETTPETAENAPETAEAEPKPKKKRKLLPILLVGAAVAAGGTAAGLGIAHIVGERSERAYFEKNPTAYCLRGAMLTLDEAAREDEIYQTIKNSLNQGTLTVGTGMNVNNRFGSGPVELVQTLSYDLIKGEASFNQTDSSSERPYQYGSVPYHLGWFDWTRPLKGNEIKVIANTLPDSSPVMEKKNTISLYTNIDTISGEYSLFDQQGSYCINSQTIRDDFRGSDFDGSDGTATKLYIPYGNDKLNIYEMVYTLLKNRSACVTKANQTMKQILNHVDEYGEATIRDGKVTANEETLETDEVTYSFKGSRIKKLAKASEEEILVFLEGHQAELSKALVSSDETVYQYLRNKVKKLSEEAEKYSDATIEITIHLDKRSHRLLRFELDGKDLKDHSLKIRLDTPLGEKEQIKADIKRLYADDSLSYQNIDLSFTLTKKKTQTSTVFSAEIKGKKNGKKTDFNCTLTRKENNQLNIELSCQIGDNSEKPKTISLYSFLREYSLSDLLNSSYSVEDTITLQTDKNSFTLRSAAYPCPYSSKQEYCSDITFTLSLSSQPQIKPFVGKVNFFDFRIEQAEELIHSEEWTENYNDYTETAIDVDTACKTYFSSIVSGSIREDNFSSTDYLPDRNADASTRKNYALNATVGEALRYAGIYDTYVSELSHLRVTLKGDIYSEYDTDHKKEFVSTVTITPKTPLRALFYR